jgi:hypothetical protein
MVTLGSSILFTAHVDHAPTHRRHVGLLASGSTRLNSPCPPPSWLIAHKFRKARNIENENSLLIETVFFFPGGGGGKQQLINSSDLALTACRRATTSLKAFSDSL